MNYLVHLYLSDPDDPCLLGNLMGDFVKGRLDERWPPGITRGIDQHRKIDAFAHTDATFRRSRERIDGRFGYFRGILVDIFYDHLLARGWQRHASVDLETFSARVYRILEENFALLPEGLKKVAPRMIAHDWLGSYRERDTIARVLERISARLSRPNPVAEGMVELERHVAGLEADCDLFLLRAGDYLRRVSEQKR